MWANANVVQILSYCAIRNFRLKSNYGAFTLTETENDTETNTDNMPIASNGIRVSVQYEHLHTILHKQFFIGLGISIGLLSVWTHRQNVECVLPQI